MSEKLVHGYLASVVGLSASGKSTAIKGARALLLERGLSNESFHDRTSDPASAKLDRILHDTDLSPESRMYLILAARRQIIDRNIIPSLSTNDVTMTDRYYPCTVAYQAHGEGLDRELVARAAISAAHGAIPQKVFVLDVPAETAMLRMQERNDAQQIFDDEQVTFHERVRQGYLSQAYEERERFMVIDGLAPRHEVAAMIADVISHDIRG